MFVCFDFVHFFFFFLLAAKLIGLRTGCQFLKKMLIFPHLTPLSIEADVLREISFEDLIKDFAIKKSRRNLFKYK